MILNKLLEVYNMTNNNSILNSKEENTSFGIPNEETKKALAEYERMCLDKKI